MIVQFYLRTKRFSKKFAIKTKDSNINFSLKVTGNLNILNKKINFTKILLNQDYKATKEDLKYLLDNLKI